MQNILIQLRGMVVKNNLAFGYADNPRAVFSHQLHRMQVYHHADALFANFAQDIHDPLRIFRVERGDRFIGQQNPRVLHQGPANGHALHLAAGEIFRSLQRMRQHIHPFQQGDSAGAVGVGEDFE